MHRIWFHDIVFLIRPTSTHNNNLQVILKISIFRFADPSWGVVGKDSPPSPRRNRNTLIAGAVTYPNKTVTYLIKTVTCSIAHWNSLIYTVLRLIIFQGAMPPDPQIWVYAWFTELCLTKLSVIMTPLK